MLLGRLGRRVQALQGLNLVDLAGPGGGMYYTCYNLTHKINTPN